MIGELPLPSAKPIALVIFADFLLPLINHVLSVAIHAVAFCAFSTLLTMGCAVFAVLVWLLPSSVIILLIRLLAWISFPEE